MNIVAVGAKIKRKVIHDQHGGNRQKGISRPKNGPYLFLFSNPERGREYGYYDGWGNDGCYHYCGEGRVGDQEMTAGNLNILEHQQQKRSLELFKSTAKGVVARLGQFVLDEKEPHYTTDAPGTDGVIRTVIMFRLRPVDQAAPKADLPLEPVKSTQVKDVAIEQHNVEQMTVSSSGRSRQSERREAKLVKAYSRYLATRGHHITRKKIIPEGEVKALYTDLYDATDELLIEAKANVTREAIRMAIGQLFDYRRHLEPKPAIALLLPSKPRLDLLKLCHAAEVAAQVIWPEGDEFVKSTPQTSMA
ncbi:restriction endonuclease [Streptomyces sp. MBT27]|uniref:restriction endonuclease n=1 Tax=Streptomyces sp. MBT27 TaxID=1488356 RepID=UPI00141F0C21|nr:restriction endonuclease [Streptomyces sp. MBT27]